MAALGAMAERLLQERIETVHEKVTQLQDQVNRYDAVANALAELPDKISHQTMVPLGKRAMVPGEIVRPNEVLAHLGDEYFAWRSTPQALEIIERKKKALCKQMKTQEENVEALKSKKTGLRSIAQLQKFYEKENIREIQETEEESKLNSIPQATEKDIQDYFELEEEERLKQEQATWNWDDVMKRLEDLEACEAAGKIMHEEVKATKEIESAVATQAVALKTKGNEAFAEQRFQAAAQYYSQAIELDPTSYILYGNRAAAYHRLKRYKLALKDSDRAVSLHETWVKGHYRRACALAAIEEFGEASKAYERAMELCPTDEKLKEKATQMREMAIAKANKSNVAAQGLDLESQSASMPSTMERAPATSSSTKPPGLAHSVVSTTSALTPFSGSIVERDSFDKALTPAPAVDSPFLVSRPSRFHGTNYTGQTVTLEPVGEAQPVKRVSRFKAARSARG